MGQDLEKNEKSYEWKRTCRVWPHGGRGDSQLVEPVFVLFDSHSSPQAASLCLRMSVLERSLLAEGSVGTAAAAAAAAERICCSANLDLLEGVSLRSCQAVVTGR